MDYVKVPPIFVSIPKRVSAKVELILDALKMLKIPFQSLKGFQPKWNETEQGSDSSKGVSIPKRVSVKVELFLRG